MADPSFHFLVHSNCAGLKLQSVHFHTDLRGPYHLEYIPFFEKVLLELKSF